MDYELRKLERLAAQGDPDAIALLARYTKRTLPLKPRKKPRKVQDIHTLDEIAELLGVEAPDLYFERLIQNMVGGEEYEYSYRQALKEGLSEGQAEEAALAAEGEVISEYENAYIEALTATAEHYFGVHQFTLRPAKKNSNWSFKVGALNKNWKLPASRILETINGHGVFEFSTIEDLRDSIPVETFRQAALEHLQWIRHYGEVYGQASPQEMINRRLRY